MVVTDKNFLESNVQQLKKENNDLKEREAELVADNIWLQAELQIVTKQVQEFNSLTVEASQLRGKVLTAEQSQQALKDEVSQLQSSLSFAENSQQSCEDNNKKLLADNLKLLHQQDQLEKDISDLWTIVTGRDKQIIELTVERDKLQAEVSKLRVTAIQPIVSPSGAVLRVIPFELDSGLEGTDNHDDINTALSETGSSNCPHMSSLGELSPPTDEDMSCSHLKQAFVLTSHL